MNRLDPERLHVLAHELRSPVAALAVLAETAPGVSDRETLRRMVDLGIAAAHDVDRIVSDPELVSLRLEPVDLAALVVAFRSPAVGVETQGSLLVSGDATRLRQLVSNLVGNALRHGARATLEVFERDGQGVLSVTDDGPGFVDGFDPFVRGASGAGSTGYGLWLARAVAEAHGGTLELDPAPGARTRLRLTLPSASAER